MDDGISLVEEHRTALMALYADVFAALKAMDRSKYTKRHLRRLDSTLDPPDEVPFAKAVAVLFGILSDRAKRSIAIIGVFRDATSSAGDTLHELVNRELYARQLPDSLRLADYVRATGWSPSEIFGDTFETFVVLVLLPVTLPLGLAYHFFGWRVHRWIHARVYGTRAYGLVFPRDTFVFDGCGGCASCHGVFKVGWERYADRGYRTFWICTACGTQHVVDHARRWPLGLRSPPPDDRLFAERAPLVSSGPGGWHEVGLATPNMRAQACQVCQRTGTLAIEWPVGAPCPKCGGEITVSWEKG